MRQGRAWRLALLLWYLVGASRSLRRLGYKSHVMPGEVVGPVRWFFWPSRVWLGQEAKRWDKDYPKIQILTIEQLLNGARVDMPPQFGTFKQAPKADRLGGKQEDLGLQGHCH